MKKQLMAITILGVIAISSPSYSFFGLFGNKTKTTTNEVETTKHDAAIAETVVGGELEVIKIENERADKAAADATIRKSAEAAAGVEINSSNNETSLEMKKLDMQDKQIIDVMEIEKMKMELELQKLKLIEAQRLENEYQLKKLEMETKEQAARDAAAAKAASRRAAAAARARKEKEDLEILKMLAQ